MSNSQGHNPEPHHMTIVRQTVKADPTQPKVLHFKYRRWRLPRKVKKWVKKSPFFHGFYCRQPIWSNDGEFMCSVGTRDGMQDFRVVNRKIKDDGKLF